MYRNCNVDALRSWDEPIGVLLSLFLKQPLEEITVKQIMDATVLLRYKFDQIVNSDDEVLDEYIDLFLDKVMLYFHENAGKISYDDTINISSLLMFFLRSTKSTKNNKTKHKQHKLFRRKRRVAMAVS